MNRVLILSIGMFSLGLDAYVLAGLLPGIGNTFEISLSAAGQIITAFTLSYALLSPVLAAAGASLNRKWILIAALTIFAIANIGSVISQAFWVLLSTRILAGAAAGLYAPSAAAMATHLAPDSARGKALALVLGGLASATVFGVPLGLFIASYFGWRSTLMLVAGLAIVAMLGVMFLMPSVKTRTPGLRERFSVLAHPAVLGRIGVMFFASIASLGLYTYLAPMLTVSSGLSESKLPLYFFLWGIAGVSGNAIAGWMLDKKVSDLKMLTISLCVLTLALALFPVVGKTNIGAGVLMVLWGASVWSLQVPLQHQLARTIPEHAATGIALLASGIYLGSAVGSAAGAAVLEQSAVWLGPAAAISAFIGLVIHLRTSSRVS